MRPQQYLSTLMLSVMIIAVLAGCGGQAAPAATQAAPAASNMDWSTAKSAVDNGGMDALVAAAKAEGELNVITLPCDWCNYGEMMDSFTAKYGIKVNSLNPDGGSADEI